MYKVLLEIHSKRDSWQNVAISSSAVVLEFDSTLARDRFLENLIEHENVNGIEVNRIARTL
ncbi:hypothetical protein HYQ20_gp192 [Acinetobacter phage vB_AbaM_Berthold]|uniref:Uncharacterized protein n=3 Tax=Lazarusvirus TaxID=2842820 RepID=A0A4Y1NLL4_9CAUD|nr:hypothetical protein HYQ20_gp192 [Acinetobacter phage vB_AbaM_Berthold]YP_009889832.1 hypothetical protein HYP65_gp191 [Acinetobacter phage AM101]QGT54211.1 hypothetical protein Stupor_198 [Acinetobacter phage Stupor]QKN88141.1 hypothetical protein Abraxas_202 [Acinetobacter phage Abraxas]UJH94745.1 hypothetical protein PhaR5_010 [Acinetobacter phage PhaR5]UYL85973.1 hypothetical protein vBAbaPDP45_195 [Acinetobacter phage vB_AbaM_DP45]WBF78952.1 hypothetical protein ADLP2_202 [Acinetobact